MKRTLVAQRLIDRLNRKVLRQLDLRKTLILGVVLKGLPIAYSIAKMSNLVENFVPIVAQRHIYMQHHVESYFPSKDWEKYFRAQLARSENLMIIDDVVNTGFTRQKVESIVHSISVTSYRFAALVLNRKNLANPSFVGAKDIFATQVNADDVECDWGLITVPLWDLSVEDGLQRCEDYFRKFWQREKRTVAITYQT